MPKDRAFASELHRARSLRTSTRPADGPLPAFLWRLLCDEQISQSALEKRVGVSRGTIGNLLNGRAPTERTYRRLRDALGDGVPEVETETTRRRKVASGWSPEFTALGRAPEARQRAAESMRGRKYPKRSEGVRRMIQERELAGGSWNRPDIVAWARSPQGRMRGSLTQRLRGTPAPRKAELSKWASEVGARLDLSPEVVMAAWTPTLQERGLIPKKGRPPNDDRRLQVAELMAAEGWTLPSGRARRGFWPMAAAEVSRQEGKAIDAAALKRWWYSQR